MRRRRQAGQILILALAAAASGCRCKGDTKLGDKRGFACAEVPSRDAHDEVDLGEGKRLVRDGVRASIRGVPDDVPVLVTSLDGATGPVELSPPPAAVAFVVGLGHLPREHLAASLGALAKKLPLVVAVAGPEDEVDVVRAAIGDAGKRVVDGGAVRAVAAAGLEVVAVPGSDDPSSIPEHGRGCVVRAEDVRALAGKLGAPSKPRVAVVYSAPSRDPQAARAADALGPVRAWIVGGPLDRDGAVDATLAPTDPPPLLPSPRATSPRTTSTPGLVSPGFLVLRAVEGAVSVACWPKG